MNHNTRLLACAACLGMALSCAQPKDHAKSVEGTTAGKDSAAKQSSAPKESAAASSPASKMTVMRPESDRYKAVGFAVYEDDGRLWVFRSGSEELESYRTKGAPAERVSLIGGGPGGTTIMGEDRETLLAYSGGGNP